MYWYDNDHWSINFKVKGVSEALQQREYPQVITISINLYIYHHQPINQQRDTDGLNMN